MLSGKGIREGALLFILFLTVECDAILSKSIMHSPSEIEEEPPDPEDRSKEHLPINIPPPPEIDVSNVDQTLKQLATWYRTILYLRGDHFACAKLKEHFADLLPRKLIIHLLDDILHTERVNYYTMS